jgi:hypothetical protein
VATLKEGLEAWRMRSLADLDVIYIYLDGFALRVRNAGKVVSMPVLGVVAVLADGGKQLLARELCGGESFEAGKGCLDDLAVRGLRPPLLCIIDGNAGLRRPSGSFGPGPRSNAAVCTSCGASNVKRRSTRRFAMAFIGSSMLRMARRPAQPSRSSSVRGPSAARA